MKIIIGKTILDIEESQVEDIVNSLKLGDADEREPEKVIADYIMMRLRMKFNTHKRKEQLRQIEKQNPFILNIDVNRGK